MRISSLTAFLSMLLVSLPAMAETKIMTFDSNAPIVFNETKPVWYKSTHFHIPKDDSMPFEVALDSTDVEKGEWSMHLTNPKAPISNKVDLTSQLLFVGMRYKFE